MGLAATGVTDPDLGPLPAFSLQRAENSSGGGPARALPPVTDERPKHLRNLE
jgi:hypothetical protein